VIAVQSPPIPSLTPCCKVRCQFDERPGIMTREEKPDYSRCVSIVAAASLREMVKPGLLAVLGPVAAGVLFR